MNGPPRSPTPTEAPPAEAELRRRLAEAEETLAAILGGNVDAVVVSAPEGRRVSALEGPDRPFQTFVERMREGALTTAADGTICYANPFAAELVGHSSEALVGRPMTDLVAEPWRGAAAQLLAAGCERAVRGTCDLQASDGRRVPVQLSMSPLPRSRPAACAVVITDLTEQEELEREEAARREAEAANLAKDQFLAVLSHELRTPLNAILGWAQLLAARSDVQPEQAVRGLEVIERNARAQTQLIDDLLDISRIVAGKLRLELQRVHLGEVVEAAIAAMSPAAEAKGITVERDLEAGRESVLADPDRLQQVVWNLISNAVKYTGPDGRVRVSVRRLDGEVEVRVADDGEGIDPEMLPRLFQLFEQGDSGTTRRSTGLGLGLAIVKQLTELHGGSVSAESEGPGRGSTFVLRLPLARDGEAAGEPRPPADVATAEPAAPPAISPDLGGLSVLLVEDEDDSRDLLAHVLEGCGARVTAVASAQLALDALAGDGDGAPYDALVSDIAMPGRDGFWLIREVRERGLDSRTLPAIALTAYARPEERRGILLAGFQIHLPKPVDHDDLCAAVASLCGRTNRAC
ncbi:MAG TPA: ATP-binding protein [Thermoanaerobaculia bacterium]